LTADAAGLLTNATEIAAAINSFLETDKTHWRAISGIGVKILG
jgi:hypothetical protein